MNRLFATALLALVLSAPALAQNDKAASTGKLPPYFHIPDDNVRLRFTSHEKPEFVAPEYPELHKSTGKEGVVEVEMYVSAEGKVVYTEVEVSSGDELFDHAALESAMQTTFPPGYATVNGEPTDFKISIPFYFLLSADPEQYWHTRLELARIQQEYDQLMGKFQSYLGPKSTVSKEMKQSMRNQLEDKIALAKNVHRILAEKKESAILRLRNEITETRAHIENNDEIMRDPDKRFAYASTGNCEVRVALPQAGIVTLTSLRSDKPLLEQLASEIELKKSYL
jgi:TonB family protein